MFDTGTKTAKHILRDELSDIVVDRIINGDEDFKDIIRRGRNVLLDTHNGSELKIRQYGQSSYVSMPTSFLSIPDEDRATVLDELSFVSMAFSKFDDDA